MKRARQHILTIEIQGSTAVMRFLIVMHYISRGIKCSWKKDDNCSSHAK
jgi:hypothetical protein